MSVTQEHLAGGLRRREPWFKRLGAADWVWAALLMVGSVYAHQRYAAFMDAYEVGILYASAVGFAVLGWYWKPMRALGVTITVLSLFAVWLYGNDLGRAETNFFLKFLFSGQSATMWMSALFVGATFTYFLALGLRSEFTGKVASAMTWSAVAMGLVGMLVRWRESYLIAHDVGHIPVSNLYEVFILFCIITAMLYLYYERRYRTRALGGFAMLVISAAVAFLLWYTFTRNAQEIQPLIPALQSYWMKIHVPANFVGYGAFALAAMVGVAYLFRSRRVAPAQSRLPAPEVLDDVMYKAIALGFGFFTIATVLGAMWAAEAWGGYWSWDPKETWALIVWLNYAAWLHMRLTKGWRGRAMAWWAVGGLLVTTFAFLGVNMFLSGLHSYGGL